MVIWVVMLVIAFVNGAIREALLIPIVGHNVGRAISTLTLSVLVVLLTYLTIRWIGPQSRRDARMIGGMWAALTLAFEFLAGHFLFRTPWSQLIEDYNVVQGRIWVLVLGTIAVAPRACAGIRNLLTSR